MIFTACVEPQARVQAFHKTRHPPSRKLREVLPPQTQFDSNGSEFVDLSFSYKNPHHPDRDIHTNDYHFQSYALLILLVCSLS